MAYIAPVQVQVSNDKGTKDVSGVAAQQLATYTECSLKAVQGKRMTLPDDLAKLYETSN